MELKEKITLDMLTKDSVSVLRQQFLTFNGVEVFVRENLSQLFSAGFVIHICIADVSADLHFFTAIDES